MEPGDDLRPRGFLPRLGPEAYRGRAVVFWTHTMQQRTTGWLHAGFHAAFREAAIHAAVREDLICPIYTLMPDHIHLLWMGLSGSSDQRLATRFLRSCLSPLLKPRSWQHQPHDHVLREDERRKRAFTAMVRYIAENPVRAELTDDMRAWPYTGCVVPGYPDLHPLKDNFWDKFWRLYSAAVACGRIGKSTSGDDEPAV